MNTEFIKLLSACLLMVWAFPSDAHSSLEAMQAGGSNLHGLIAAAIHPLVENGFLVMAALLVSFYSWLAGHLIWRFAFK